MATFATNDQIRAQQTGFANHTNAQVDPPRMTAYSRIVSALHHGGYAVSAIVAAPTKWALLRILETRLVTLDLLGGGGASTQAGMAGGNFKHWLEQAEAILKQLADGQLALVHDDTGAITDPPRSPNNTGIISDGRTSCGVTLDDPEYWPAADLLGSE